MSPISTLSCNQRKNTPLIFTSSKSSFNRRSSSMGCSSSLKLQIAFHWDPNKNGLVEVPGLGQNFELLGLPEVVVFNSLLSAGSPCYCATDDDNQKSLMVLSRLWRRSVLATFSASICSGGKFQILLFIYMYASYHSVKSGSYWNSLTTAS